jgi:hypothetical protein
MLYEKFENVTLKNCIGQFDFFLIFRKTNEKFDKFLPQNLKSSQIIK